MALPMSRAERIGDPEPDTRGARVRFDKWLWAARFFKTRSLAAQAVSAGQARLNGERVKPAQVVHCGDLAMVRKRGLAWEVRITGLDDRRGSASDAATLYAETPASSAARAAELLRRSGAHAAASSHTARPTKRERRRLEEFLSEP